jgi:putative transposase
VPTVKFQLLHCFFVIEHGRRRILRFNVTDHPTAEWVVQQLREAFPDTGPYRYAIFDRDSTFNEEVVTFLEATGLKRKRTSAQAPRQNGVAERWIGSARRDCFDHVIALNEAHVRRLGRAFIAYYHEDRTHLGLDKDTLSERPIEGKPDGGGIGIGRTSRRLTSSIHLESGRVNIR